MNKIDVEPFLKYPESIIDSKHKAIKAIKGNCYYFYVIGIIAVLSGSYMTYTQQSIEDISCGINAIITGIVYISLSFVTLKFESRFACWFLAIYLSSIIVYDIYLNAFNGFFIVKLILALAVYRMIKATHYLNKAQNLYRDRNGHH